MNWPWISREEYDTKVKNIDIRIKDLERHFVTKRDDEGKVIETLADVPVEKRNNNRPLRGMSWPQRRAVLEATDGFRKMP